MEKKITYMRIHIFNSYACFCIILQPSWSLWNINCIFCFFALKFSMASPYFLQMDSDGPSGLYLRKVILSPWTEKCWSHIYRIFVKIFKSLIVIKNT
jgi:hypothetical protein